MFLEIPGIHSDAVVQPKIPKLTILKIFQSIKSICGTAKTSGWPPDTNLCQVAPPAPADSRHLPVFLALTYSDFSCLSYLWNAKLMNQS